MGDSARRGRPPHPGTFTPAEARVLEHLRAGHSNAEIADALGVTIHAVKFHVSNMLAKTGATTREELAAWQPGRDPVSARPRWWATFTTLGAAKVAASLAVVGIGLAGAALTISALAGGDDNDEPPAVEEPSTTTQPNTKFFRIDGAASGSLTEDGVSHRIRQGRGVRSFRGGWVGYRRCA